MINSALKSISYIYHPLLMPLVGVILYFSKTPRFFPIEIIQAKIVSLFILTIILPILIYFLLKTIKKIETANLKTTKERIILLLLYALIYILIIQRVLPHTEILELYYFFLGILISSTVCFLLAVFKFKASIHILALGGLLMFAVCLSLYFKININGTLALIILIIGATGTSRLHLKAHNYKEIIVGLFIGALPQLLLYYFW